jgi:flagellar protein FlgJ
MDTQAAANQLAIDVNGLAQVKRQARNDPRAALKGASQQFEAVFLQMVLKSMRDATPKEGLFDNEQTRLYQSMLDQQLAQTLSAKGSTGLAALMEKQLARGLPPLKADAGEGGGQQDVPAWPLQLRAGPAAQPAPAAPAVAVPGDEAAVPAPAREFVNRLWPQALEASRATGIPAHFMIAQAALETGWGKAELRFADGSTTYNLFGIKAGRSWHGAVAEATTTEYVNGAAQKTVERFRAYSSYAEAFRDYANLLASNPRYAGVLNQQDPAAFAKGLQQAGYATDPMYADKLTRIIGGATLRAGLTG